MTMMPMTATTALRDGWSNGHVPGMPTGRGARGRNTEDVFFAFWLGQVTVACVRACAGLACRLIGPWALAVPAGHLHGCAGRPPEVCMTRTPPHAYTTCMNASALAQRSHGASCSSGFSSSSSCKHMQWPRPFCIRRHVTLRPAGTLWLWCTHARPAHRGSGPEPEPGGSTGGSNWLWHYMLSDEVVIAVCIKCHVALRLVGVPSGTGGRWHRR